MIRLIYSPVWFYGKDIIIDVISAITLLLISFFSFRCYKMQKNKNHIYLSLSFLIIAISFLFKILMNFTVYYHVFETKTVGFATFTYQTMRASDAFFFFGYLFYRLLTLLGLYLFYSLYQKQSNLNFVLVSFLVVMLTYYSQAAYYIFYLTCFVMLTLITISLISSYKKNKFKMTKMFALSFGVIALSQILFILVFFKVHYYAAGEIIQLIGYLLLLLSFIMVLRDAKKN